MLLASKQTQFFYNFFFLFEEILIRMCVFQFNIQRLAFEEGHGVETLEEAKTALWNLIDRGAGGGLKL